MTFKYESVVPWGRSFEEYVGMFNLTEEDLDKTILGCGDGPASFNACMNKKGKRIISVDPIYQMSKIEIEQRIAETFANVMGQTRRNQDKFIWDRIVSIEELGKIRMQAMTDFLSDYDDGKNQGRYIPGELPHLPKMIMEKKFDLVLCAHFLFFYSDNLSLEFHFESLNELCRIGNEIRIFPLVDVNSEISLFVEPAKNMLMRNGWNVEEVKVGYQFQKTGNTMLRIFH